MICFTASAVWADETVFSENEFAFGMTEAAFQGLNVNDSAVALKAWTAALAKEQNLDVKIEMMVYPHFKELQQDFWANRLDAANLSTIEFRALKAHPDHIYLPATEDGLHIHYCLVARADSEIESINQFIQHNLVTYEGPSMVLSGPWLHTLFADENSGHSSADIDDFLGKIVRVDNPSNAILQVFFGQADAALLTLDTFDTACVLNPQLRKELRVVYRSQPLIVDLFLFNPAFANPLREKLEEAVDVMDSSTKGRQVLTIFRCSRLVRAPMTMLEPTEALLDRYERLRRQEKEKGERP